MAPTYCTNCGQPLDEGQRFCSACGAAAPGKGETPPPRDPAPPPPPPGDYGHSQPPYGGQPYGEQGYGPVYDATPGLVMGILGFFCGGLFLHIPALIMGSRGRAAANSKNADAAYWTGLIGVIWDVLVLILVISVVAGGGFDNADALPLPR